VTQQRKWREEHQWEKDSRRRGLSFRSGMTIGLGDMTSNQMQCSVAENVANLITGDPAVRCLQRSQDTHGLLSTEAVLWPCQKEPASQKTGGHRFR
jgi:hypothetical protein